VGVRLVQFPVKAWEKAVQEPGKGAFSCVKHLVLKTQFVTWLNLLPQKDTNFSQMEMSALKVAEDINAEYWSVSSKSGTFSFALEFCNLVNHFVLSVHEQAIA